MVSNALLMVFAVGSGLAKVVGIELERTGAEELGVAYGWLRTMGVLQLCAAVGLLEGYLWIGALLIGLPYLLVAVRAAWRGQPGMVVPCLALVGWCAANAWWNA